MDFNLVSVVKLISVQTLQGTVHLGTSTGLNNKLKFPLFTWEKKKKSFFVFVKILDTMVDRPLTCHVDTRVAANINSSTWDGMLGCYYFEARTVTDAKTT